MLYSLTSGNIMKCYLKQKKLGLRHFTIFLANVIFRWMAVLHTQINFKTAILY